MIMERHISKMPLEAKVAQMVFPGFWFTKPDFDTTISVIKKGVGGFCIFGGSIFDMPATINSFQRHSQIPLLIASDLENGAGQQISGATIFPSNMAIGATRSEELSYLKGKITGVEAKVLGIHMVLAPVMDVNSEPTNPIINIRSYGAEEELVIQLGKAFSRGLRDSGILTCAKHFPGHGSTKLDSHLTLPTVSQFELKPFASIVEIVDSIMTAHILVSDLDSEYPASLSKKITTDLLRNKLKFNGLIATDAILMGGATNKYRENEALILAANAGADILLMPKEPIAAINTLVNAVKSGELSESIVDKAVERILSVKGKLGLFINRVIDVSKVEMWVGNKIHKDTAQKVADASITLVKDDINCILLKSKKIFYHRIGECPTIFINALKEAGITIEPCDSKLKTADIYLILISTTPRAFSGRIGLEDAQIIEIENIRSKTQNIIAISFGNPYILSEYGTQNPKLFQDIPTYICAYSDCEYSQRAVAKALLGQIGFNGRLPVRLF